MATGVGVGLSSCEDFLTITPTSSIVEEEFWQDKNDLTNAVMACYKRMVDNDLLAKYVYWGEERSDNFVRSSSVNATSPMANIMNGNLLPTYGQFDWTPMYNAINYCNKVLAHGPEVVDRDESFSDNDWKPIKAEVTTLRALAHFYLVRTFGEVPYITQDYNNDSQELRAPQSTQLAVLDSIVNDLESIKADAMMDYGNTTWNKGRITRKAVYALLADVYLWRASYKTGGNQPFTKVTLAKNYKGNWTEEALASRHEDYSTTAEADYQKCIEYCDLIIDMAKQEELDYIKKYGLNVGGTDVEIELEDLLSQEVASTKSYIVTSSSAYNDIFGTGNSDESIFELQVQGTSSYSNNMVTDLYYNIKDGKAGSFTGTDVLFATVAESPNSTEPGPIYSKTDYRRWNTLIFTNDMKAFDIGKYVNSSVEQYSAGNPNYMIDNGATSLTNKYITQDKRRSGEVDANWIVYRLSEIYLMKAEAMTQLYADEAHLTEAYNYVREVFKRSNPFAYATSNNSTTAANDSLKFSKFNTPSALEELVMKERQREFVGEGKRWYDLVRYALRRGNTSEMLKHLSYKYDTNSNAIKAKLADMQTLFSPVYNNEIKNNNLLYQNGVWFVNETSSRTDEL